MNANLVGLSRVKRCFEEGTVALNSYVGFGDPALVEVIALGGFDAVTIDLEHMTLDLDVVRQMIVTAEAVGITSVVRVPFGDWQTVLRVLDAGAQGIQITHVRDKRGAQAAVDAVRYPPLGQRGALATSRAARYGTIPWETYAERSNRDVLLAVLVEDVSAIASVEEIASTDGLDLVTIGPLDLAESMGIRAGNDERVRHAVEVMAESICRVGKARLGLPVGHPALPLSLAEASRLGASWANVSPSPEIRLRDALRQAVEALRAEERS